MEDGQGGGGGSFKFSVFSFQLKGGGGNEFGHKRTQRTQKIGDLGTKIAGMGARGSVTC